MADCMNRDTHVILGSDDVTNTIAEVSGLIFARELIGSFLFKTLLLD